MSKKLLSTVIASLFVAAPALAQSDDPMRVEGTATIGGIYNNQNASDSAKLEQYQDLGNGVLSSFGAQGRSSAAWFQGYAENIGRSDQYLFLRGGMFDVFKGGAYLNDMPHNFSSNAISPYTGTGGAVLVGTFPQLSTSGWSQFNLGYDRRDMGGYFEWQKNSPWYFRADGNQVKFDGTKVGSAALGTSPGNGYAALAFPVQSTTDNFGLEGATRRRRRPSRCAGTTPSTTTTTSKLNWSNPFFGNQLDTIPLAPTTRSTSSRRPAATATCRGGR